MDGMNNNLVGYKSRLSDVARVPSSQISALVTSGSVILETDVLTDIESHAHFMLAELTSLTSAQLHDLTAAGPTSWMAHPTLSSQILVGSPEYLSWGANIASDSSAISNGSDGSESSMSVSFIIMASTGGVLLLAFCIVGCSRLQKIVKPVHLSEQDGKQASAESVTMPSGSPDHHRTPPKLAAQPPHCRSFASSEWLPDGAVVSPSMVPAPLSPLSILPASGGLRRSSPEHRDLHGTPRVCHSQLSAAAPVRHALLPPLQGHVPALPFAHHPSVGGKCVWNRPAGAPPRVATRSPPSPSALSLSMARPRPVMINPRVGHAATQLSRDREASRPHRMPPAPRTVTLAVAPVINHHDGSAASPKFSVKPRPSVFKLPSTTLSVVPNPPSK